jgi:hypothetical protein
MTMSDHDGVWAYAITQCCALTLADTAMLPPDGQTGYPHTPLNLQLYELVSRSACDDMPSLTS